MSSAEDIQRYNLEIRTRLRDVEEKCRIYESALQELASSLSVKHVLVDLQLSQTAVEALRQSLEQLQESNATPL